MVKLRLRTASIILTTISLVSIGASGRDDEATNPQIKKIIDTITSLNRSRSQAYCGGAPDLGEKDRWLQAGFGNPSIEITSPPSTSPDTAYTHSLSMTFVMFRNSGWTKERVNAQLARASQVYKQCGIKLADVKFVIADAPGGIVDVGYSNGYDERIANLTPATKKPTVYFMRSNPEGQVAYSWDSGVEKPTAARFNTTWMTDDIDKSYRTMHDPTYNVLAHELGHILCGCKHIPGDEKNLMAGRIDLLNDKLKSEQCETFKKSTLLKREQ